VIEQLAILSAAGLLLGYRWWRSDERELRRLLRRAERVPIAEVGDGQLARVVGSVMARETIEAPLSGRPCVYFEVVIMARVGPRWRGVFREARGVRFAVDDGSGRALIDPAGAGVSLVKDHSSGSWIFPTRGSTEAAYLARHDLDGRFAYDRLRYREGIIEVGETVAVLGRGVREPDREGASEMRGYRDAAPTVLRLGGSARAPILISDDPDVAR
jgi:hypothetical protein